MSRTQETRRIHLSKKLPCHRRLHPFTRHIALYASALPIKILTLFVLWSVLTKLNASTGFSLSFLSSRFESHLISLCLTKFIKGTKRTKKPQHFSIVKKHLLVHLLMFSSISKNLLRDQNSLHSITQS